MPRRGLARAHGRGLIQGIREGASAKRNELAVLFRLAGQAISPRSNQRFELFSRMERFHDDRKRYKVELDNLAINSRPNAAESVLWR